MSSSKRPGRPARLSRDAILAAALAIADEQGIEAVTMRAIGQRLDSEAMSLYRHVRDKEDLLDGLIDMVFGEIEIPATDDWKAAMRGRAISARQVLARHRWAVALMESRLHPGPANLRHHDDVVRILDGAGLSAAEATHAGNLLDSFIFGFVVQEHALPFSTADEFAQVGDDLIAAIPDDYPHLKRVGGELLASGFDYGDEFEFGLDFILDALERRYSSF